MTELLNEIRTFSLSIIISFTISLVLVAGFLFIRARYDIKVILTFLKNVLITLLISGLIIYSSVVAYWLLYPYNVIDVEYIKIKNQGKTVKQGGTLIYEIKYTKFNDIVGIVHRQLVNTYTITYSDAIGMNPPGQQTTNTHLPVPLYASPGKYHLLWRVTHPVNPMRSITETVWSDEFEIIPGDDSVKKDKIDIPEENLFQPKKKNKVRSEWPKKEKNCISNSLAIGQEG